MPDPLERSPIAAAPLSVLLPAHNAQAHLGELLQSWIAYLDTLQREYEILLIDDGSTDDTRKIAEDLAGKQPRLLVLRHENNRGFGASLRTGLAGAHHPLLFYSTCDRLYSPAELKKLLDRIDQADLVSSYRAGRRVPISLRCLGFVWWLLVRIVVGFSLERLPGWLGWRKHAYQRLIRFLYGVRLHDIDSAFKLFRRSIFDRIPLQSDGPFVHAEILAKANFLGCLMDEVPIGEAPLPEPGAEGPRFADGRRVFNAPDFGPTLLPGKA